MVQGNPEDVFNSPAQEFDHFVRAQAPVYDKILRELAAGQKSSHWMWFIFPQLRGLGHSPMAERYAIESLAQARRYAEHSLLGARLRECTQLVLGVRGRTAEDIFGYPDWMKFRSSMTLFSLCAPPDSLFAQAIDKYFAGERDDRTLELLDMRVGD
jgi:uncharacterized protein (DUF1810 family)